MLLFFRKEVLFSYPRGKLAPPAARRYEQRMLGLDQVNRIAMEAAAESLGPNIVARASTYRDNWPDGEEMLRISLVLRAALLAGVTGEQVVNALSGLQDRLRAAGETRFAAIDYETDAELATHGGS